MNGSPGPAAPYAGRGGRSGRGYPGAAQRNGQTAWRIWPGRFAPVLPGSGGTPVTRRPVPERGQRGRSRGSRGRPAPRRGVRPGPGLRDGGSPTRYPEASLRGRNSDHERDRPGPARPTRTTTSSGAPSTAWTTPGGRRPSSRKPSGAVTPELAEFFPRPRPTAVRAPRWASGCCARGSQASRYGGQADRGGAESPGPAGHPGIGWPRGRPRFAGRLPGRARLSGAEEA
jgi:hypothetical protein